MTIGKCLVGSCYYLCDLKLLHYNNKDIANMSDKNADQIPYKENDCSTNNNDVSDKKKDKKNVK